MQTGNRDYFGRNQFWTPSNISITQSIIDDKLNNITLNDNNSSELFTVNDSGTTIQTKNNVPLEASQFVITGSNEEIDANENNAVNKRYLSTKINSLEDKYFLKSNIINKDQTPSIDTVYSSDSTDLLLRYKSDTTYVDKNLDLKANVSYVDEKLDLKANSSDVYNKTEIDNKLSNIPTIDNIYTKTEVDNLLLNIIKCESITTQSKIYEQDYENTVMRNIYSSLIGYFSLPDLQPDVVPENRLFTFVKVEGFIKFKGENVIRLMGTDGNTGIRLLQLEDFYHNPYPLNFAIKDSLSSTSTELTFQINTVIFTDVFLTNARDIRVCMYYSAPELAEGGFEKYIVHHNLTFTNYVFTTKP